MMKLGVLGLVGYATAASVLPTDAIHKAKEAAAIQDVEMDVEMGEESKKKKVTFQLQQTPERTMEEPVIGDYDSADSDNIEMQDAEMPNQREEELKRQQEELKRQEEHKKQQFDRIKLHLRDMAVQGKIPAWKVAGMTFKTQNKIVEELNRTQRLITRFLLSNQHQIATQILGTESLEADQFIAAMENEEKRNELKDLQAAFLKQTRKRSKMNEVFERQRKKMMANMKTLEDNRKWTMERREEVIKYVTGFFPQGHRYTEGDLRLMGTIFLDVLMRQPVAQNFWKSIYAKEMLAAALKEVDEQRKVHPKRWSDLREAAEVAKQWAYNALLRPSRQQDSSSTDAALLLSLIQGSVHEIRNPQSNKGVRVVLPKLVLPEEYVGNREQEMKQLAFRWQQVKDAEIQVEHGTPTKYRFPLLVEEGPEGKLKLHEVLKPMADMLEDVEGAPVDLVRAVREMMEVLRNMGNRPGQDRFVQIARAIKPLVNGLVNLSSNAENLQQPGHGAALKKQLDQLSLLLAELQYAIEGNNAVKAKATVAKLTPQLMQLLQTMMLAQLPLGSIIQDVEKMAKEMAQQGGGPNMMHMAQQMMHNPQMMKMMEQMTRGMFTMQKPKRDTFNFSELGDQLNGILTH